MKLTRRSLLAGIGGGTLVIGGLRFQQTSPAFTQYTYAAFTEDTDDAILRVAWYESRNGTFRENQAGSTDSYDATMDPETEPLYLEEATYRTDVAGPVLRLGNILPGDSGTLVVGLEAVSEETPSPVSIWLSGVVTAEAENGRNEPERKAGDTTDAVGELATEATVEVWTDTSPLGSCDGLRTLDETLRAPVVPRAPFGDAFAEDSIVANEGVPVFDDCLDPGTLRCVALAWELPKTASDRIQGDSFTFDFAFAAGPCEGDSPFLDGGSA
ncbi:hypothetical protein [Halodesulfurarchaeum sp.]|uniref:hypothetical protein n=1 Tax=Halodesulfurarchaeum sp. TaxID=1980530 RepID=UPI001BBDC563|nr:hypothetical protein [Halodesulfurarchaeum sp.]